MHQYSIASTSSQTPSPKMEASPKKLHLWQVQWRVSSPLRHYMWFEDTYRNSTSPFGNQQEQIRIHSSETNLQGNQ
jgi:hypothetical protein